MILQRLRVRANRAALGVEHAHRVRNNVEDRLELRDAAREVFAELFALADVVAGEEKSAAARLVGERRRTSSRRAVVRRDAGTERAPTTTGTPPRRGVDLVGEIGERVRKRVVDRHRDGAQRRPPR